MITRFLGIWMVCWALGFVGCETTTQTAKIDPDAGVLKRSNPAAILKGKDVEMNGLVRVQKADSRMIPAPVFGSTNKSSGKISLEKGPCEVVLESSFNRGGQIYIFEGEMTLNVDSGCNYYPVAGLEANSGKAWMWIQDDNNKVRASDRVEARFVKVFEPAEENFLDIYPYESIIDPDVLAERKAACDLSQVAGYEPDLSLDRGDEAYGDRDDP